MKGLMMPALYIPTEAGVRALDQVSNVPWSSLKHAYSGGTVRDPFTGVQRNRPELDSYWTDLADDDEEVRSEGLLDLGGCLYHQGDLYEATAYAVPFLCALAVEPIEGDERELLSLLVDIALATTYAKNAAHTPAVRDAFARSTAHVDRVAARPGFPTVRRFLSELAHARPLPQVDLTEFRGE